MLKIGFIDYYLDEWHANNYPAWIREASNGEMEVAYCWAEMDAPNGGLTSQAWADQHGAVLCSTQEELIAKSDVLCVLAPDNPETHERLTRLALESGKITYVDKTFAPDTAAAQRMIALAEAHNTPMITTSALRYATEYQQLSRDGLVFCIRNRSVINLGNFSRGSEFFKRSVVGDNSISCIILICNILA